VANKTDTLTDKHLVERVLNGDTNAFAVIIKNTEALVAQIVFKMINNAEDRKDVAQDIYMKAYKSLNGFRFGSKLSTWIGQIAYNACTDHIRKKKLVLADDLYEDDDSKDRNFEAKEYQISPNESVKTDNLIFQKELSVILNTEIEKLSPVFKTLICLYHNEQMNYDEIAQITQLPQGTVKSYLFRARKALKDNLLRNYKRDEL
jgi:RNA polymerase sigma factor (sigma-70 family)